MKKETIVRICLIALFGAVFCFYLGSECAKYDLNHSFTK